MKLGIPIHKDMIYVVAVITDEGNLDNVFDSFYRQDYNDKRLIVVEFCNLEGICESKGYKPDAVVSARELSANAAIQWINQNDTSYDVWFTILDESKQYKHNHLQNISKEFGKGDVFVHSACEAKPEITLRAEGCPELGEVNGWLAEFLDERIREGAACMFKGNYLNNGSEIFE